MDSQRSETPKGYGDQRSLTADNLLLLLGDGGVHKFALQKDST